ncbi:hypothetical protein VIGAN_01277000 [Vigna angularis var. angularis]|uniref:Uncharacterized protein n=1 Tax=Vigna angularis var. angularis TaxID=157739 RepID=A0A0S3R351_PHAAN|nr:hypothetical protein VIGAN_01277000 [Vigna angularis var. angularis]
MNNLHALEWPYNPSSQGHLLFQLANKPPTHGFSTVTPCDYYEKQYERSTKEATLLPFGVHYGNVKFCTRPVVDLFLHSEHYICKL